MTPADIDILLVTLFTWSLKVRFSSSVTPRNLTVETFVRMVSRILMSNAFFWLEIIIYEVLLTFRESLLVLSQTLSLDSGLSRIAVTVTGQWPVPYYCYCHWTVASPIVLSLWTVVSPVVLGQFPNFYNYYNPRIK